MPLVLLIDHGVVSERGHSEPPSQKRKSDNGNLNDFHNYYIYYIFYICDPLYENLTYSAKKIFELWI